MMDKHILDLSIEEIHEALVKGEVKPSDLVKEALKRAHESKDNAFEMILDDLALKKAEELDHVVVPKNDLFFAIPYVLKDNYSTKGIKTTASSNILNDYIPLYDATIYSILKESNAIMIAKASMDELAMGGTGTTSHIGTTFNPFDKAHVRSIGGSSSGSAASVASAVVPFAIGSDTGDSVRKPASYAGLVGYKPTWGLLSRYGLFSYAPSLDTVAYFTRDVVGARQLFNLLKRHDDKDSTSLNVELKEDVEKKNAKNVKLLVFKDLDINLKDEILLKTYHDLLNRLKKAGMDIVEVEFGHDLLSAIYPTYNVISFAEATSNNANLDGVKFGPRPEGNTYQEVMMNARTKGFSNLIKRRFVIGSYVLYKENQKTLFLRAKKVRRLIVQRLNELLKDADGFISLAAPNIAPKFADTTDKLSDAYVINDNYLAIANFSGGPSITLPIGLKEKMPFGINITAKAFDDLNLLNIAEVIESFSGMKGLSAKEVDKYVK